MNFLAFKNSQPAQAMFRKLGVPQLLEAAQSWRSLRKLIVDFNDCDKGYFVDRARACEGQVSSGERVLLQAILYASDFAWLADEFAADRTWRRMDDVGGEWREAVAACIALQD
jgi:hypothetical protein